MKGYNHRKSLLVLLMALAVSACVVTAEPEWVASYVHQPDTGDNQITWLNDMASDSYGNILAAGSGINVATSDGLDRTQDAVIVTFSPAGEINRVTDLDLADGDERSDDQVRRIALDPQDNVYALIHQYGMIDDKSGTSSWLVSFDANGSLRWKQRLSKDGDVQGLAWHQGRVYTAGNETLAHDAHGNETLRIEHPETARRSIDFADNGDLVVAGKGVVSRHDAQGEKRWQYRSERELINKGSVTVTQSGDVVFAEGLKNERGGAVVARLDTQGNELWSQTLDPARSSYGSAGPALVMEDYRGDLYAVASNAEGRRMVKFDASGSRYWNKASSEGIVQDADLTDGGLFIVGNGYSEKRDGADGSQIAEAPLDRSVQNTQGSLVVDGSRIYTGYAALDDEDRFAMFVSRYEDQPIN